MIALHCERVQDRTFMGTPIIRVCVHQPGVGVWLVTCSLSSWGSPRTLVCLPPIEDAEPSLHVAAQRAALNSVDWEALRK